MPRKMLMLIGLVLITALVLTACATATPTTAPAVNTPKPVAGKTEVPTVQKAEPVTIEWWHITTAEDQKAVWQKLADEYMALHPEVTINITVMENENFKTKMTTIMQAGTPPDIFQSWGGGTMNTYAKAGLLRDITPELDADGGAWRNSFASAGVLGTYAADGKNYGVPWDAGMTGVFYNVDLFATAGVTAPIATWTDMMAAIEALKAAGITPMVTGGGDKWPSAFIYENLATRIGGQAAFDAAANTRTGSFTDPAFVQAGEKLLELVDANAFQDGFLGATWGDEATAFGNGKAAMDVMGQWGGGAYKDNAADKVGPNLGWFPFPIVEGGAGDPNDAVGGGNGFAVGKNAPDAAVDFLKYLTRAESQDQCAAAGFCVPVITASQANLTDPILKAILTQLGKAKYYQLYYDQFLPPAMGSVVNDSVQAIMAKSLTPAEAAQAIEDSAKQEIK
jgi:raffinose/stachyose/melibiose transport system substrate-binding protein